MGLLNAVWCCTASLPFRIITASLLQPRLKVVNSNHKFRLKNGIQVSFLCLKYGKSLKPGNVKPTKIHIILVRGWPGLQKINLKPGKILELFLVVWLRTLYFWDITQYHWVTRSPCFEGTPWLHLQQSTQNSTPSKNESIMFRWNDMNGTDRKNEVPGEHAIPVPLCPP